MNLEYIDAIKTQRLIDDGMPILMLSEDYYNITFYVKIEIENKEKLIIINKNNDGLNPVIIFNNDRLYVGYGHSFDIIKWIEFNIDKQYELDSVLYSILSIFNMIIIISELDVIFINFDGVIILKKSFNQIIIGYKIKENGLLINLEDGQGYFINLK